MLKQCTLTNYITGKIFLFKGSPSREGHETGFSVLTTIELCLPVEFTKPWKQRTVYIKFNRFFNDKHELRAKIQDKIYKLPLMCYELQDMKYETQTMSYKLRNTRRDKRHGRETGPSYIQEKSASYSILSQFCQQICYISTTVYSSHTVKSSASAGSISKFMD
jgi:hypothetical protein